MQEIVIYWPDLGMIRLGKKLNHNISLYLVKKKTNYT